MANNLKKKVTKDVTPFWEIIPYFFIMPLKGYGIITLILFSIIWAYFSTSFFQIIIVFATIKYAIVILQTTAYGNLNAPKLNSQVLLENYELPIKQLMLFILPVFVLFQLDSFIEFIIGINFLVFYLLALPASIMLLASTYSFLSAINPKLLFDLITRIGWSYGILYCFLLLLNGGTSAAFYFIEGRVSGEILIFLQILIQIYFGFVMYAMMGYVLYQYHENIGYITSVDIVEIDDKQHKDISTVENFVSDENYEGAKETLMEMIRKDPDNLELRKKFHKVVKILGDSKQLTYHGAGMIGRLLSSNQTIEAVNVYLDCLKVDPIFKPEISEHYLPLADTMRNMRLYKETIKLINGFHQQFPNNSQTPYLYLLAAKIFIEDLSQDEKARSILVFLKKHYSGQKIESEVDLYNNVLTKV